jgi:hypothetical protein
MNWLTNLLRRRILSRSRNIFQFFDGNRLRRIDPAVAIRSLDRDPNFDWENDPPLIAFGDEKALARTVAAVQRTFGVQAMNETGTLGLTETESVELLISFVSYLDEQKKNGRGLLILPASTASASSEADSTTKPNSGSGSTSNDNSSETVSPST